MVNKNGDEVFDYISDKINKGISLSIEMIANKTGLTVEEVKSLKDESK